MEPEIVSDNVTNYKVATQILNSVVEQLSNDHPFGEDLWEGLPIKKELWITNKIENLLKNELTKKLFRVSDVVKDLDIKLIITITHFMLQQKLATKTNKLFTTQALYKQIDSREIALTNKGQVLRKIGSFDKLSRGMRIDKFYRLWVCKNTITIIGKIRLGLIKVLIIHQKSINKLIEKLTIKP